MAEMIFYISYTSSFGCVVNPDTGKPVIVDGGRLATADFRKVKVAEIIEAREEKHCKQAYKMRQADPEKIHRMAPIEFIGRYMPGWFDYVICDEIHQLAGDTAQGNALGTLADGKLLRDCNGLARTKKRSL
jgi:hypothetical protein